MSDTSIGGEIVVSDVSTDDINEEEITITEDGSVTSRTDETDNTDDDGAGESTETEDDSDDTDSDTDDVDTEDDEDEDDTETQETISNAQTEADSASAMLAKHSISYNALVDEFEREGALSASSVEALVKAGFPKEVVESYITGQQAKYNVYADKVLSFAGGEEEYGKLCVWASKNLSEAELKQYNEAVESMDLSRAKFAVRSVKALKESVAGSKPERINGQTSKPSSAIRGYATADELADAVTDPRYGKDKAFTEKVNARLLATD